MMLQGTQTVTGNKTFNSTIFANNVVAIDLVTLGNRIDLDADNNTSIRASLDDQIDFEIGGIDKVIFSLTSASFVETI
ncbi:hypothetical protein, partial [Bacillus subtilis]|uniref:hypothetical protein n=1 Tax=Bacillus subtilis TaxID=1423 RepID=UPI003C1816A3